MATVQQYFDLEDCVFGKRASHFPTTPDGKFLPLVQAKLCIDCSFDRSYWRKFGEILRGFSIDLGQFADAVNEKYSGAIFGVMEGDLHITRNVIGCDIEFFSILRLAHSLIPD